MTMELTRVIELGRIGPAGLDVRVDANAAECAALAQRMNLPGVLSLRCDFHLSLDGEAVDTRGHLVARVVQTCILSLEEFEATVEERFKVRFVPSGTESDDEDPDSIDELPYEGNAIDLGEAAAEQLGLALDPYPRMPGATLPEELTQEHTGAFAALAALRRSSGSQDD